MNRLLLIFLLMYCSMNQLEGQTSYLIKKMAFNSGWNEFSPVYYREGVVFCSNQPASAPVSYGNKQSGVYNIFYVPKKDSTKWKNRQVFAREISVGANQGPATFSKNGEIMYYSRNNNPNAKLINVNDSSNKLGIYSAEFSGGKWTNVKPFDHNNELYTFCTPSLSDDGNRLYISSDRPGGYGGLDLYYCERKTHGWDKPVNLGALVNTPGNESFPFACKSGKLFFATDGKPGFGGKDIFYTLEDREFWIEPVHLDSAINSPYDDFGLIADYLGEFGYFSSNRAGTDDIYSFSLKAWDFGECQNTVADNFCFTFYDDQQPGDTLQLIYEWDFGGGIIRFGTEAKHCFPGPGDYIVKLSIRDKITGEAVVNNVEYKVSLKGAQQPCFNGYKAGLVNKSIFFNGSKSGRNGASLKYFWDFGKGYMPGDSAGSHIFDKEGEYTVKMGVVQNAGSFGNQKACVQDKVRIYNSFEDYCSEFSSSDSRTVAAYMEPGTQAMHVRFYFMDDLTQEMKSTIKNELKETEMFILFDNFGIAEMYSNVLDKIALVLKRQTELRLNMALHIRKLQPGENDPTEDFARKISFFLHQKGVDKEKFNVDGFGDIPPLFKPYSNNDSIGVVEVIFMKE